MVESKANGTFGGRGGTAEKPSLQSENLQARVGYANKGSGQSHKQMCKKIKMGPRKVGREQSERDFWGKRRNSRKAEPAKRKFAGENKG